MIDFEALHKAESEHPKFLQLDQARLNLIRKRCHDLEVDLRRTEQEKISLYASLEAARHENARIRAVIFTRPFRLWLKLCSWFGVRANAS